MSKEEIYDYIKQVTYKKKDLNGEQLKITATDILKALKVNKQSMYSNLSNIHWIYPEIKCEKYKIRRFKKGKTCIFRQRFYWIV